MRRFTILVPVLLVSLSAFGATDTIRKGFNVSPGGTLRLDAHFGEITVVTGGEGVAVEIVRSAATTSPSTPSSRTTGTSSATTITT
jgi:hypothetical protein